MPLSRLLIANRGEVAVRIARAAAEAGLSCHGLAAADERSAAHARPMAVLHSLPGRGPAAYRDLAAILAAAQAGQCDALHPGYGFLSESAELAEACAAAGLTFVGPEPVTLRVCGDKAATRRLAKELGIAVPAGSDGPTSLAEAEAFRAAHPGALMLKALAGGGGRGLRRVGPEEPLEPAWRRCASEAAAAGGSADLYVEALLSGARHIEVQLLGDGDSLMHLWERDCSAQRRQQKLIELAPAPALAPALREQILGAALRLGEALSLRGLATVEFLVVEEQAWLIEINPRLQVEHTVTEEVTGVDLVQAQLAIAGGACLAELGLDPHKPPAVRGQAMQLRLNAEDLGAGGLMVASRGRIAHLRWPDGPGLRIDTAVSTGDRIDGDYDSLLAKLIISASHPAPLKARALRALDELELDGLNSNRSLLAAVLREHEPWRGELGTDAIDAWLPAHAAGRANVTASEADALRAPMAGRVVAIEVAAGTEVAAGQELLVLEAMKMEHVIAAPGAGRVQAVPVAVGEQVLQEQLLLRFEAGQPAVAATAPAQQDLAAVRADLEELQQRLALTRDQNRPEAIAKRHALGFRSARENIAAISDAGSFQEYGALAIAMQRSRRREAELRQQTPADGLVCGVATVNAERFGAAAARCALLAYDYTVLAGTQGGQNHRKTDRILQLARADSLPLVFFTEGGGGRPGDTDAQHVQVTGLECASFSALAGLAGRVPLVGVANGRCFAGNAAFLGCCDVVIATAAANIGMGGPAMIAGGGLGEVAPEEIGPAAEQRANGVIDIAVANETEAAAMARRYLGYFQGALPDGEAADQRLLRQLVPENRLRAYAMREAMSLLCDRDSLLELRADFGRGMLTALARIDGRPLGLLANNPQHLGGAIDSEAADKAARFLRLCNAFGLPVVFLCDTPGIMVGPEAEASGTVRHAARLFLAGAQLEVPFMSVVLRKAYGLGAQAMFGGHLKAGRCTVAWPTGEFGPMGLEGAVRLGFRRELEAIADPEQREQAYQRMVEQLYARGKAVNVASHFEIDAVIDPAETRDWIVRALRGAPSGRAAWRGAYPLDVW